MWNYLSYAAAAIMLCCNVIYWQVVRPARQRARLGVLKAAELPQPEPREPADMSRPYPRPEGRNAKLNRVCPICGTGRETGDLDGRLLGWRAHRTCAEWLGEWKPTVAVAGTRLPLPPRSICVSGNLSGIVSTGDGAVSVQSGNAAFADMLSQWRHTPDPEHREKAFQALREMSGSHPAVSKDDLETAREMLANGHIDHEEFRTLIDRKIVTSFGIPPTMPPAGSPPRPKKPSAPVYPEWCTCGLMFTGTAEQIAALLHDHKVFGLCPHSAQGRRTDLRIAQGITATGGMERQRVLAEALRTAGVPLPVLTHAKMVGRVDRVGVSGPAIWYVVCSCGVTVNGMLEEMASCTQAHMGMCASRIV